ncbi:hypothetical protein SNE40_012076 [Patella caerulea]|uniref:Uncharacterized protein n=1 Tax=Patella caerulea TaxID=87958 RepID=A0AAN8JNA6_PATCE
MKESVVQVSCGGPEYGTEEAVEYQKRAFRFMKRIGVFQLSVGFIAFVSAIGALVCGFMVETINYPVIDIFPLLTSVLAVLAGYFALKTARCTPQLQVDAPTKRYVIIHYVIDVTNVSFASCSAAFAGWAIGVCKSTDVKMISYCNPNHDTILIFGIINCVAGAIIAITCIPGMIFFCIYARVFGFTNREDRVRDLENRINNLQRQLENQRPPPYDIDEAPPSYQNNGFKY